MRRIELIISDIKNFVNSKGFIYSLCMILFEDFRIDPEKMHEIDYIKRLNTKEASLLLGFLIQKKIDFSTPDSPQELFQLKQKTYDLMEELHHSFWIPFGEKLKSTFEKESKGEDISNGQKEFFSKGDMLIEPIFYSSTGVYDFQYLEFLDRKYKYDKNWLLEKKDFDFEKIKKIVTQIKNILQDNSTKIRFYNLKEKLPQMIEEMKKKDPNENWEKQAKELLPMMELHQYVELFFNESLNQENFRIEDIKSNAWQSFYQNLVELFVFKKSDLENSLNIDSFLNNYSISFEENLNSQFQNIGNFNLINVRPIIKLDEIRYFVPISFLLFEAVYENPFYWMWSEDMSYRDQLGQNRGQVGEEITFDFLSKVFGMNRTFKAVKITSKKGIDDTDIDVLCVLGTKALCVQVKSKKLTELSRTGNDEQLHKDFKGAVQDAYDQGLIACKKILDKNAKFINENGNEIKLSEEIDEVYIMGITTENYPALTHMSHVMLNKKEDEPFPIVLTIFDLELIVHYLDDPYDFLYYIKQRISLMDYFEADEEIVFLGYHLDQKLWKMPNSDFVYISNDFGKMIDRNYYPIKAGLNISDEGDAIKKRWQNEKFSQLCSEIEKINSPKITDIIFQLFDLSGRARVDLVNLITNLKQKTYRDNKAHNFSMPPDSSFSSRLGITYVSLNSDDENILQKRLLNLCQLRKYRSKADGWIGLGSFKNSNNMIDVVTFNNEKWEFDDRLEQVSKEILDGKGHGKLIRLTEKVGRNDKCPCGSGIKYKNCCGKN